MKKCVQTLPMLLAALAGRAQAMVVYQCDFSGKGMDKFTLNPYESAKGGWLEKSEKLSGSSCLAARGENEYYQYFARIRPVMLKPGTEYRLHVSAKKKGGGSCVVHFFMLKNGNLTSPPQSVGIRVANSDRWKHYQRSLTVPEGLEGVEIRFRLCNADENAVVYLDDLKIEAASPRTGPDPAKPNLIYECDFDEKMGDRIRLDKKMGGRLSDEQKLSHEYALSAIGNKNYYQVIAFVSDIPFRPGKTYKASIWAKGTGQPASVNISHFFYRNGGMANPPRSRGLSFMAKDKWEKNELTFVVPPDFKGGEIRFRLVNAPLDAVVYLDDYSLSMVPVGLNVDYRCSSRKETLTLELNVADFLEVCKPEDIRIGVDFLSGKTGEIALHREESGFTKPVEKRTLSFRGLPKGKYSLRCKAHDGNGKLLDTKTIPFAIFRDPEWAGNELGVLPADAPPPWPWPPLRAADRRVHMWGRTYEIGPAGLPAATKVLGEDLLTGPIRLRASGPIALPSVTLTEKSPQRIVFAGRKQTSAATTEVTSEIEYDGMIKYTLKILPGEEPVKLSDLHLEIPFVGRVATLLSRVLTGYDWWKGATSTDLASESNWTWKDFNTQIWIGDGQRGLAWFAESNHGWNVKSGRYFAVNRREGMATLRVQFVDTETTITEPREFVFGFQATPTRPHREDWKKMHFRTRTIPSNMDVIWSNVKYFKYHATPDEVADDPTEFLKLRDDIKYCLWLVYPHHTHDELPQYKYFHDRWATEGSTASLDPCGFQGMLVPADSNDPLWCDFLCHKIHRWVKKWKVRGMYHDGFGPQTKDGRTNIFAFRELAKRMYIIHRQLIPDAMTVVFSQHYSSCLSFCDANLTGEGYRVPLAEKEYYPEFLSFPQFRGDNVLWMGPESMILPQYKVAYKKSVPHAVHAMGMYLLHDLMVYASWMNMDVYDDLQTRRIRFGWDRAKFFPYWKTGSRARADRPETVLSYYEKPDGLFVVAFNNSREAVRSNVRIGTAGLELGREIKATVYDPLEKKEHVLRKARADEITVPLDIKGYMMQIIEIGDV